MGEQKVKPSFYLAEFTECSNMFHQVSLFQLFHVLGDNCQKYNTIKMHYVDMITKKVEEEFIKMSFWYNSRIPNGINILM